MGDIGDTTDELKSISAARTVRHVVLGIFVLGGLGFAAGLSVRPPQGTASVTPEATAAIDAEAQRLGKILAATATSAHAQAETMAVKTQIRAGILTDAATVKDLVTSEIELPRNLSQTLELLQLHGKDRTLLLSMPDGSAPIAPIEPGKARFVLDGRHEPAIVTAVPVKPVDPSSEIIGELVISTPLDFTLTREALAAYATRVEIGGSGWSFVITPGPDGGPAKHAPLALGATGLPATALDAIPRTTLAAPGWIVAARWLAIGIGLAAAVVLAMSLYRNRTP